MDEQITEKNIDRNSFVEWNKKWDDRYKSGWVRNKGKYRLLRRLFPKIALKKAPRKSYYTGVAKLAEGRFCDLGCGMGAVAGIYALLSGEKSFGIDQSHIAMKYAMKEASYFNVTCAFSAANIYHTGIKSNSFETVYLGQVLEHLDDEMGALNEALRILLPGGKFILSVPKEGRIPDPDHVREYTDTSLRDLLAMLPVNEVTFHDIDPRRLVVSCRVMK